VNVEHTKQDRAVRSAVRAAYAGHAAGVFVRLQEFLAYHGPQNNPLVSATQGHPHATLLIRDSYEAEIGRFAERKGRHMGTLFKITKRSILAAAAAGITAEQTFETLQQCCATDLPPNVQREISGWFVQCRRASLGSAVLICCPDAETAARLQAVAESDVILIVDTIFELHDWSAKAALLRKLREAAIFVSSDGYDTIPRFVAGNTMTQNWEFRDYWPRWPEWPFVTVESGLFTETRPWKEIA
jgi:hypothetical protein